MAAIFQTSNRVCGIRHWALWRPDSIPRYEVYRYVGYQADTGVFYFRSIKTNTTIVARSMAQLSGPWFKPFVIDTKSLEEYIEAMMKAQYNSWPQTPPSTFPPDFNGA